jgi:hypothetical protein
MKFSQNLTWQAIGVIQPTVLRAKELGAHLNLVAMLRAVAVDCFLQSETNEFKTSFPKTAAAHVIRTALEELNSVGQINFGEEDNLW